MKKILLHTCCAPCSTYVIKKLREEGYHAITSYWYNINIHPYTEYKARLEALKEYTQMINIPLIVDYDYGIREFTKAVCENIDARCEFCYRSRLERTVKYAKEHGYEAFSTTLLVSPYQKHEWIKKIAEELANLYKIEFIYYDFREGFREGQQMARDAGLYMQKYCGCIYSEQTANYDHIISEQKVRLLENRITEKKIRLGWEVPDLELRQYKNGKQEEIKFIYDLKKEVYMKYIERAYGEWNEENQKKLFERFMKENSKNIELIYLKDELIGFYNGKDKDNNTFEIGNICIKPEYQNKGIGTAVLKEILFENKGKDIILQCFKDNPVIKLYERMGLEKEDETETHCIMKKRINQ